ncbi:hypothetical protein B296_00028832 [Ensete ventricosum]|uniref:Uncharacterized protein n=1 Tax=Ensete ventricosum TaxID=4639 RepID=A0A427AHF8_ENSVE|nr:hypothetical protein B296_00028832 [Ensete ventricosum]
MAMETGPQPRLCRRKRRVVLPSYPCKDICIDQLRTNTAEEILPKVATHGRKLSVLKAGHQALGNAWAPWQGDVKVGRG